MSTLYAKPPKKDYIRRLLGANPDRAMTYIAAFHCKTGIVMCADTQETVGDYKDYVEKISIAEDLSYPIAVGGAGSGPLIDALTQEIIDRARESKPATKEELKVLVRASLSEVYRVDLPTLALKNQHKAPELLVAARTSTDGFCILATRSKRVLAEVRRGIIGYSTQYNNALLKRLHDDSLTMQQAVMLGIYLVSQSKALDDGVGGDTRVVVVVDNGAWIDDPDYIANAEVRIKEFLQQIDALFLASIDTSLAPSKFRENLGAFGEKIDQLRNKWTEYAAAHKLNRAFHDPKYRGDPYAVIFPGAVTTVMGDSTVRVHEQTKEELDWIAGFWENAKNEYNAMQNQKLAEWLKDREIVYFGEEPITLAPQPASS